MDSAVVAWQGTILGVAGRIVASQGTKVSSRTVARLFSGWFVA